MPGTDGRMGLFRGVQLADLFPTSRGTQDSVFRTSEMFPVQQNIY